MGLGIPVPSAAAVIGIVPAAARSLRMALGIAVPAAVSAAATPVIIVVIIVTRSRAGEPSLVIPCRHRTTTIVVIVPAAAWAMPYMDEHEATPVHEAARRASKDGDRRIGRVYAAPHLSRNRRQLQYWTVRIVYCAA